MAISVPIKDISGAEVGSYEFDSAELSKPVNKQLLHDAVVMYQANARQGTVQTKSRGMVKGSTKKLYRQKGTGRARAGNARTPVRRGGGHTFGKKPRDFSYRLPRKAVRSATRMALLSKFEDSQVVVLSDWQCGAPATKHLSGALQSLGLGGQTALLATDGVDVNVWKSGRNIQGVRVLPAADLNAYEVLRYRNLVITQSALDGLLGRQAAATA